jgi:DNA polymerase III psi subunit
MEKKTPLVLSNYQCAILNEMGISSWQLASEQQTPTKVEVQIYEPEATSSKLTSKVTSKVDALGKLKQLKAQTQTSIITDSVLVALSPSDVNLQIFNDVLIALSLETKQQKCISIDQLHQFSGYSLSWIQGEKVNLYQKQLTTPALAELKNPEIKKLLWQQLHSVSSFKQN